MKLEGALKIVKRKIGAVDVKISGIKAMRNNIRMEIVIADPFSIGNDGKILIEIPEAKKPEPPKPKDKK